MTSGFWKDDVTTIVSMIGLTQSHFKDTFFADSLKTKLASIIRYSKKEPASLEF